MACRFLVGDDSIVFSISEDKFDKIILFIFGILSISSCVTEALSRNCVRVLLFLLIVRLVVKPDVLKKLYRAKSLCISTLIFYAMIIFSAIYGGNFWSVSSESMFSTQYTALLLPACLLLLKRNRDVVFLLYGLFFSMLLTDIYIFYQVFQGVYRPVPLVAAGVMKGTCLFVILIPAMLISSFDNKMPNMGRLFSAICAVVSIIGLICTNTRGGWLAIVPVVIGILLYYIPTWKKKLTVILACCLLMGVVSASVSSFSTRIDSITRGRNEQSVNERFLMWDSAIKMGLDHPLLGVGNGNYKYCYQNEYISPQAKEPDVGHAHSMFFQMLGENGFIGLLAYCGMIGTFFYYGYRRKSAKAKIILASTMGLVLYGLTDYTLSAYEAMRVYWFLMGLCIAGIYVENNKNNILDYDV